MTIPQTIMEEARRLAGWATFEMQIEAISKALLAAEQRGVERERERDVGLGLLLDIYRRHMVAFQRDEPTRARLFNMIGDFEWAFPEIKRRCDELYPQDAAIRNTKD